MGEILTAPSITIIVSFYIIMWSILSAAYIRSITYCGVNCQLQKMPATYQEEQEQVKAEFNQAAGEGEGEEEEGESMLTLRKKCKKEM